MVAQTLETSNIGSAGEELRGAQGSIQYNIGEVAIGQHNQLNEGVIQYIKFSTIIREDRAELEVSIFPNPTSGPVNIKHNDESIQSWIVTDGNGRVIDTYDRALFNDELDFCNFSSGQYYLIPVDDQGLLTPKAIQIIK